MDTGLHSLKLYEKDSLCFSKEDFLQVNFNADTFVKVHQATHTGSLDLLRDDLGIYLKILRSSMIELINRDYADFVNLSTNLSGLDNLIEALKTPLGQLREEVLNVKSLISDAIDLVTSDLASRHQINQEKALLHRLCQISTRLTRLENLVETSQIHSDSSDTKVNEESISKEEMIDRVASEVNHLNFLVSQCEGAELLDTFKPRVDSICRFVEGGLEKALKQGIKGNQEVLLRTLRIYTSLGTIQHAHFQVQLLVRDKLDVIIHDNVLKSDPRGLKGLFEKTLNAVNHIIGPLLTVQITKRSEGVGGFCFLEQCAFPEISQLIIARLSYLFNPGNPAAFHQRYSETLNFLQNFEKMIGSEEDVIRFRQTSSYQSFMEQWNLPVYYQIRYQEIGLVVEASLSAEDKGLSIARTTHGFLLSSTAAVYGGLLKTFDPDNFLLALLHRFWKLALLILARHRSWISSTITLIKENSDHKKQPKYPAINNQIEKTSIESTVASGCEAAIFVLHDIDALNVKLADFFEHILQPRFVDVPEDKCQLMKDNIESQRTKLGALKTPLVEGIVEALTSRCGLPLKQVNDTPRLYRRTNKAIPTKHQSYVDHSIKPLQEFVAQSHHKLTDALVSDVIRQVFYEIAARYNTFIYEVLHSVYKMEESLKRLKRARDRGVVAGVEGANIVTDDDKIRTQIFLDVQFLGEQLSSLGVKISEIEAYGSLVDMVTKAKNGEFVP